MSEMPASFETPDHKPDNRLNGAGSKQSNPQVLDGKADGAGDAPHNEKHKERPDWFYQADWPNWCVVRGPDKKRKRSIFSKHVHPIIPFGAPVTKPNLGGGKVVGQKGYDGRWSGKLEWTTRPTTLKEADKAWRDGAALCMQGVDWIGLDGDIDEPTLAKGTLQTIIKHFGPALSMRWRRNSSRFLITLRREDGERLFSRIRLELFDNKGEKAGAFEVLGAKQQYLIEGMHKSGVPYEWTNRPCDHQNLLDPDPLKGVPRVTHVKLEALLSDLIAYYEHEKGYTVVRSDSCTSGNANQRSSGDGGRQRNGSNQRRSIDNLSLHAPSPQHVLDLLKAWRNTPENVPTHLDFVRATAMIKASLGPDREQYYSDFEEWALEYPGNDEAYVRGRWDSIR